MSNGPGQPGPHRLTATTEQAVQIGTELPELLVSLLERRYLSDFQPTAWQLATTADDGTRPLLREVLSIGRERQGEDWSRAMPHVLTATHVLGQAVVMALHGDTERHHIYLGGRRLTHLAQGSTEDFIEGQGSVLQAHIPGLRLGPAARLDDDAMSGLSEFLRSAPAVAVVTGVPSSRTGASSAIFQNVDRLVGAAGTRRYALLVVAEPLKPKDLDRTVDRCRRLKTEVHALVRRTVSRTISDSDSESTNTPEEGTSKPELVLPTSLFGLAMFCGVAGLLPGMSALIPMVTPLGLVGGMSRQLSQARKGSTTIGTTRSRAESGTAELLDANAEACETLLQRHLDRLEAARSSGWWRTSVFVAAESDGTLESVTGALRGIASGETSALDPVRVVRVAPHVIRTAATRGQSIGLTPISSAVGHPLGSTFDALATCMTSDELSVLVTPPRRDIPGLPRYEIGEFALSAPAETETSIRLGRLLDPVGRALCPVSLTPESLNRHVFITGMTGYGKTTTAKRLLVESFSSLGLPFLVIEPVKAEYRRLAEHHTLRNRLRVYTIGDERGTLPLRLNPFVPVESVPLLRHIDLLKAVFNASFPMFAGMSYVLEEAMLETYTERGWNLHSSVNDLLGPAPSAADLSALVPSIADLHDKVEEVLAGRQYAREVHQNMGAALRSRLRSLMVGTKGMTLNATRGVPASELFGQPCVIELRNLGDDEEKAFVMALLLGQLYEFAEARQTDLGKAEPRLQHLTLIEEAHRLLRAARSPGGPESAAAQAKAVAMFTDMLAEMRAYGEGFIVADQIPTKLASEILKNSNVKILHRLVAPDDRAAVANSINLSEAQSRHLVNLRPGFAVVHDDRNSAAVLVKLTPLPTADGNEEQSRTIPPRAPDLSYLHRHSGCRYCPAPCTFLEPVRQIASDANLDTALEPLFNAVLRGDTARSWELWTAWRSAWLAHGPPSALANPGEVYCAFTQASHRWADRVLRARAQVTGPHGLDANARLRRDRCARDAGKLALAWRAIEILDKAGEKIFEETCRAWSENLAARPPREMPGCAGCPARCRHLADVAAVPGAVLRTIAARATAGTSPSVRARSLATITDPTFRTILSAFSDDHASNDFLYCAVTIATADEKECPADLLGALREHRTGDGTLTSLPAGAADARPLPH